MDAVHCAAERHLLPFAKGIRRTDAAFFVLHERIAPREDAIRVQRCSQRSRMAQTQPGVLLLSRAAVCSCPETASNCC